MALPRISAVICTHEREHLLARAVASLARQTLARADYEIVVVDNASRDGTRARLAALGAEIANLSAVDEPALGVAHSRNTGARAARAPLVAYLDDDAEADEAWLATALEAFGQAPGAGCIGGPVRPRWEAARPRWLTDPLLSYLAVVDLGPQRRPLAAGEWLAGTNAVFRKAALAAVGGFCVSLGRRGRSLLSGEDVAISAALMAGGWPVLYDPALVVNHTVAPQRLTLRWFVRRALWQGISEAVARREHIADRLPPRPVPDPAGSRLGFARLACGAARRLGLAIGRWPGAAAVPAGGRRDRAR